MTNLKSELRRQAIPDMAHASELTHPRSGTDRAGPFPNILAAYSTQPADERAQCVVEATSPCELPSFQRLHAEFRQRSVPCWPEQRGQIYVTDGPAHRRCLAAIRIPPEARSLRDGQGALSGMLSSHSAGLPRSPGQPEIRIRIGGDQARARMAFWCSVNRSLARR